MKKFSLISALAFLVFPSWADEYLRLYLFPDCREPVPAEVHPVEWFPGLDLNQRSRMREYCRRHVTDTQAMVERLKADPDDEEAFCALVDNQPHVTQLVQMLLSSVPKEKLSALAPLRQFREIYRYPGLNVDWLRRLNQTPRREFIISLRNHLRDKTPQEQFIQEIYRMLEHDKKLNHAELDILCRGLQAWCDVNGAYRVAGAAARIYLQEFRNGKEVRLSSQMEYDMSVRYPHLTGFVSAERSLNGSVPRFLTGGFDWEYLTLNALLWRDSSKAVQLARCMRLTGYDLLEHKPDALRRYLQYRGIQHYRTMGQEVPECCLSALAGGNEKTLLQQVKNLEQELLPLAPRCLLALGRRVAGIWQPVNVSTRSRIHPSWPDASAVQLPMWDDSLLGVKAGAAIPVEFQKELKLFEKLTADVKQHRGTGFVLASALGECERVRPNRRDLVTPVYHRIAMRFAEDGVTLSYLPEDDEFQITCEGMPDPLMAKALYMLPQHLHRLTLMLAVLEKQGNVQELEKACSQLARVLNRSELWPLVICQRELRGFSTRALLTLFADYEGEDDALFEYGEAMGLRHEMSIARLGHEDELGDNLLRAAVISGALPASQEERQDAVEVFMELAREHAWDDDARLTGDILLHLLRWGMTEPVMQWQDCPPRYFRGNYATNGLRLIRAYLSQGKQKDADRLCQMMAADPETDTTPAYRLARALLCADSAQAARFRKDALLLAMLYRHVDYATYADYLAELAEEGDAGNDIMRLELMFSRGREAGMSPGLGFSYARRGRWESALFAFEYMLTQGLTTTTPYGTVPSHADLFYYKAYADICRGKLQKTPGLVEKALAAVAGTPAEPKARELAALETKAASQPAEEKMIPHGAVGDALTVLPARSWKLKTGSSVEGALMSFCQGGKSIQLRLPEDSTRVLPVQQLEGDEQPYFQQWRKKNGFETWSARPDELSERYVVKVTGRPVGALPDFGHPGAYYMAVMNDSGMVQWLRTWGLPEAERNRAHAFCSEQPAVKALKLAATPQEALQLSARHKLPILLLCAPAAKGDVQGLLQYLMLHPEAAEVWGRQYIILPAAPQNTRVRPLKYTEEYRRELLELEQLFVPDTTLENAQSARALDAVQKERNLIIGCLFRQGEVQSFLLKPDFMLTPEAFFRYHEPLPEPAVIVR
ncbi:MAG: hypothetical protein IKV13_05940 [Akkermansia sp.]|nr:hypothetical protein [Akkermansia sp.]